ncbi:hypothetical protein BU61_2081 [Pontoporia blainvillei]|uniref:SURP and G-patch domain-containing protein 2 n=1 Tax=Pontoporia blainvillei TaxID=48723 RepID=A0ABX0S1D2_PONBL|nr:hypothetical protein [Pontoporia blainvillei]
MQRLSQTLPGADQKPMAECAVRAMLYSRAVRSLKKRLLPGRRRGLLRAQGLRGWKVRRATTGTQTLLSSGTRLKHHGRQAPGSLQGKPRQPDGNDAAKDCPPDPARPSPQDPSPKASGPSPKPTGVDVSEAPQTSSPCLSTDVDTKTMETAEKLAKFVAQVGPEIEQFSIENSIDNPDLWFLHDQNSSAFKFYRKKVFELCPSICFTSSPLNLPASKSADSQESPLEPMEGGGEFEDEPSQHKAELESPESSSGACFPRKRVSSKSLKVGMIPAPKRLCLIQEPKVHEPVRIAYDRPRGRPVTKKKKPQDFDFAQQKLTDKNLGFQMLQKMGWKEGHVLGSCGKGIREPVSVGTASEGEGLGADRQEHKEDTFDVFRQRMMQMYRHKRANK